MSSRHEPMHMVRGLSRLQEPPTRVVLTIGNFDGIHLGHQHLLRQVVERARALEGTACLLTFDPPPSQVLGRGQSPRIVTLEDKMDLIAQLGFDLVVVEPFTLELARYEPERFAQELIQRRLEPAEIRVGYDFCFGRDRKGDFAFLQRWFTPLGCSVAQHQAVQDPEGEIISSTRVRQALQAGDVEGAHRLLGRPHFLRGVVARGDQRGRTIGFPTANLAPQTELLPRDGVYATWFCAGGHVHRSVTNVGLRPTVDGLTRKVETHVFDFDGTLYGQEAMVWLSHPIREERRFSGLEELKAQIERDCARARELLGTQRPPELALTLAPPG